VITWKDSEEYTEHSFPNEVIRKVVKLNDRQVFLLLQAIEWPDYSKCTKMEIFDFTSDCSFAKKMTVKPQCLVDEESITACDSGTIRLLVYERGEEGDKKYLLKWTPFVKDEHSKDTKRTEIRGAQNYHNIYLYPFNRMLGLNLANTSQSFSLFSKKERNTFITLWDYSVKTVGEYELPNSVENVVLSERGTLYAVGSGRILLYSIASEHKSVLHKVAELDLDALSVAPLSSHLLIRKRGCFLLLNSDFECVMRDETIQWDGNF
jgi:hypothetical protein